MTLPSPRSKQINRAEIIDQNFIEYLQRFHGSAGPASDSQTGQLSDADLLALLDSQMASRQLDLMARVKRLENKVFYTIGSAGHEGNSMLGQLTRHTDPAFLHYRSGAFMAERSRQLPEVDFILDTARSFAASSKDPASGGRHKVWGSKPLWVLPQTSTIASHLPKAVGTALAISQAARVDLQLPIPQDSIVLCSFGDASANHSTAQGAFNTAQWTAHQGLPVPILFVCEDNGIGISVKTPNNWIARRFSDQHGLDYYFADGLDVEAGYSEVVKAIEHCRNQRRPVFLHLKVNRLMGHAGTDFEVDYRPLAELEAAEALDPLKFTAAAVLRRGVRSTRQILRRYEELREQCLNAADKADQEPKLQNRQTVMAQLAPYSVAAVRQEAQRIDHAEARVAHYGSVDALPENRPPKHLAVQINQALHELMLKYPEALLFGEDVAQKGGVYTVTRQLHKRFGAARVFNTLLDEQTILGLAQGYAYMGMLPLPEIQYLAYFHNACDQIRGEACSMQFFSNDQYRNPMLLRIAGLGYQKGFGGHFHNDNSIAALRDIPGLVIGCPSRGDDAVAMLRTLAALAKVDGRVCAFLEPIALYMNKDLYAVNDGEWMFAFPPPDAALPFGEPRVYFPQASELLIISYGNGVPMSLRAIKALKEKAGVRVKLLDLRWLLPLNGTAIVEHAANAKAVLVVDEGRFSGGVAEAVMACIAEAGSATSGIPVRRVTGADCYTPLAAAANFVLPNEADILTAAHALLEQMKRAD